MNFVKRWARRLAWLTGALFLVMVGVNIAPGVYQMQGQVYSWGRSVARPDPPPPAPEPAKMPDLGPLEARLAALEGRAGPDLAPLEGRLAAIEKTPPPEPPQLPPDNTKELLARLERVEADHKLLVGLQTKAREELMALQERLVAPGAVPPDRQPDELDRLAQRAPKAKAKSGPPATINRMQREWLHDLPNYQVLRSRMSDLEILRRYGWAGVWEMSDEVKR